MRACMYCRDRRRRGAERAAGLLKPAMRPSASCPSRRRPAGLLDTDVLVGRAPARACGHGRSGARPTATSVSRRPGRSTPARARRRPSSRASAAPAGASRLAYVAITDNADPMDVVVLRAADRLRRGQRRVVCTRARLRQGRGRDRELARLGRPLALRREQLRLRHHDVQRRHRRRPADRRRPRPRQLAGVRARGDRPSRNAVPQGVGERQDPGRRRSWPRPTPATASSTRSRTSRTRRSPTPTRGTGLRSTRAPAGSAWKKLAGRGGEYNNHYAGIALGRDRRTGRVTAYVGGVGGIMALRDR